MTSPIPIILCGRTTQVGQGVINALKPEYEVIHFIQFAARGAAELPHLFQGTPPPPRTDEAPDESNIGSKNYVAVPQAIILGGGQTDDDVAQMREASRDSWGKGVPWIRPDLKKEAPPFGTREYGLALVERVKATLMELKEKGEWERDGVYWY